MSKSFSKNCFTTTQISIQTNYHIFKFFRFNILCKFNQFFFITNCNFIFFHYVTFLLLFYYLIINFLLQKEQMKCR